MVLDDLVDGAELKVDYKVRAGNLYRQSSDGIAFVPYNCHRSILFEGG
jgi:hypothetical protein